MSEIKWKDTDQKTKTKILNFAKQLRPEMGWYGIVRKIEEEFNVSVHHYTLRCRLIPKVRDYHRRMGVNIISSKPLMDVNIGGSKPKRRRR